MVNLPEGEDRLDFPARMLSQRFCDFVSVTLRIGRYSYDLHRCLCYCGAPAGENIVDGESAPSLYLDGSWCSKASSDESRKLVDQLMSQNDA